MSIKNRFEKYWLPVYLVPLVLLSAVLAYFDGLGYRMFQQLEQPNSIYQTMVTQYMQLFHGLVFVAVFGMSFIVYYYRSFRDALAFFVFSLSVLWSGVWDLLYYQIGSTPSMPEVLSHLQGTPVGTAASIFNNGVVTPEMVALNAALFLVFGLPLAGYIRFGESLDFLENIPDW